MIKKNLWVLSLAFMSFFPLNAQYKPIDIPEYFTRNADAVLQADRLEFSFTGENNGIEREITITTVLNKNGKEYGFFFAYNDSFQELVSFKGIIYDKNGKEIKKISKNDLKITEYNEGLASDGRTYYYTPQIGQYPYTVRYEHETLYKKRIIGLPIFIPQKGNNISVINSVYSIALNGFNTIKYKSLSGIKEPVITRDKKGDTYSWSADSIQAFTEEYYAPPFAEITPSLYVVPVRFAFKNLTGDMTDWKTYGNWLYALQEGRDKLPEELKLKIHELTDTCKTQINKIKILYDYLVNNTRYISIQIGIGGLQPMEATEVYKTGFGDCKGLSNYMTAILKEVGITAYNTIINTNEKKLLEDFASAQANHEIVAVPMQKDTLWLECTSKEPFGFRTHAGHDVLLITPDGGKLSTIPDYSDQENQSYIRADISINENGEISGFVNEINALKQFISTSNFDLLKPDEKVKFIRKRLNIINPDISNIEYTKVENERPFSSLVYNFKTTQILKNTGKRLFINLNPFREGITQLPQKERIRPIIIPYGFHDTDSITLTIPSGYTLESIPQNIEICSPFGTFTTRYVKQDNKLIARYDLIKYSGKFDASKYNELYEFHKHVNQLYQVKAVLKKESDSTTQ